MSIATEISRLQGAKADIKTAIEGKGVSVPSSALLDSYPDYIDAIQQGGGGAVEENDVIFIDYDGTILYSYSASEFANLTELPANPTHEGLTAQGWNWELADAKAYVAECGGLVIGQTYITEDGKTRYYITLDDPANLSPVFGLSTSTIIDWGDGTAAETATSGAISHTYANVGNYVIAFAPPSNGVIPYLNTTAAVRRIYAHCITHIRIGSSGQNQLVNYFAQFFANLEDVNIPLHITNAQSGGAFDQCLALKALVMPKNFGVSGNYSFRGLTSARVIALNNSITFGTTPFPYSAFVRLHLPASATTINSNAFNPCESLRWITFATGATVLQNGALQNCISLASVKLPGGLLTLAGYAFTNCFNLTEVTFPATLTTLQDRVFQGANITKVTLPASVTTLGNYVFYQAIWLTEVHVLATTPPSAGSGIFLQAPVQKIYVPTGTLATYQGASGWSTYANLMEEE